MKLPYLKIQSLGELKNENDLVDKMLVVTTNDEIGVIATILDSYELNNELFY